MSSLNFVERKDSSLHLFSILSQQQEETALIVFLVVLVGEGCSSSSMDSMEFRSLDERQSMGFGSSSTSSSSTPIDSSNIGFKLLKKHGWKEGTGLGISEQGRLEPIQALIKTNKRGVGADKPKKPTNNSKDHPEEAPKPSKRKGGGISKKMKKMQELEKQLEEKEFDRAFFREFWPDNV